MKFFSPNILMFLSLLTTINAAGDSVTGTYYQPELTRNADRKAITAEVEQAVAEYQQRRQGIDTTISGIATITDFPSDGVAQRGKVTTQLVAYLKQLTTSTEADAPLHARQAALELRAMLEYFAEIRDYVKFRQTNGEEKVISIKDFAAVGDGIHDDTPAFAQAFATAAKISGRVKIIIPAGKYRLGTTATGKEPTEEYGRLIKYQSKAWAPETHLPKLKNISNLTIAGEPGATLLASDPTKGIFMLDGCKFVTIRQLDFDYLNLPFTQGTITATDIKNNTIEWQLEHGYPPPSAPWFISAMQPLATIHDPVTGKQFFQAGDKWMSGVVPHGKGRYTFHLRRSSVKPLLEGIATGRKLVLMARRDGIFTCIVGHANCRHLTLEKLSVHSAPGWTFCGYRPYALNLVDCRIEAPASQPGRLLCSNGDGCQVNTPEIGAYVANNSFSRLGDDFFMSCIGGKDLREVAPDGMSIVTDNIACRPGLPISIVDGTNGYIKAESIVTATRQQPDGSTRISLSSPIGSVNSLQSIGSKSLTFFEHMEHATGGMKVAVLPDLVLTRSMHGSGTIVTGNIFRQGRNGGIMSRISNAIISDNILENIKCGMEISMLAGGWKELNPPHSVTVNGNRFSGNGSDLKIFYRIGDRIADSRPIRDLLISNNQFRPGSISMIFNCRDVLLRNNHIDSSAPWELRHAGPVTLSDNTFTQPQKQAIKVMDHCDMIKMNNNHFGTDPDQTPSAESKH
ncbi:MAG: Pectate lyase superfamily protein [Smithella sp. PtaU1.Bin162]|nr:MAG: Pectate lyase superfamily protein [Smithella sp. PtaU1.Bin162]